MESGWGPASGLDLVGPEPAGNEIVRAQLERITASPPFVRAPRMQRFIRFLVEETLAGRARELKEYTIAISVFGKPEDFEPGTSAVVRVEAGRLRRLLNEYTVEYGKCDPVVFQIPKGSYVPLFICAPSETVEPPPVAKPVAAWSMHERRLVTVLSCGVSPSLIGAASNSEFFKRFDALHLRCTALARAHGGDVDGGAGDRLIIYFGWPNALEDAAGQAMITALELLTEVQQHADCGFEVRMGVATSDVVTRHAASEGRPAVIGEAPCAATRMLVKAPPNGILVGESTRRLTRAAFDFLPAGSLDDRGKSQDLLWRLLRAKPQVTRFKARHLGAQSDIVGRREEIALVSSRWRLSCQGEGQVVVLVGEAGIGKSKIAEAFLDGIGEEGLLRAQCSAHQCNSGLFPILTLLKTQLGLSGRNGAPDQMSIAAFLQRLDLDSPLNRELLLELVAEVDHDRPANLSASQRKDLTVQLLGRVFIQSARRHPTALLVEDMHWADPTTLELLQELARQAQAVPLLLLLTTRLVAQTHFPLQTNVTSIRLTRLARPECNELIDRLRDAAVLPEIARTIILEKSGGIPLFLEELTKLFLSSDSAGSRNFSLPATLNDLLVSQLDRLGRSRAIAQVAAVIGRPFSKEMLSLAAGVGEVEVEDALDQLVAAEVLIRDGTESAPLYSFRHALLRDAAYNSLLDAARQALHGQVANMLLDADPELAIDHPELIARHLYEGGRSEESIPFWIDSGRKAAGRYTLAEAEANYRAGLLAISALPYKSEDRARKLQMLIELGLVVRNARGYGDTELALIYQQAREIASDLGDTQNEANAVYGLWTHAAGQGRWKVASQLACEFEPFANRPGVADQLKVEAFRLLGASAAFMGDFAAARRHLEAAQNIYDPDRHGPGFGFDPGAASAAYLSWTVWHLGDAAQAAMFTDRAVRLADAKGHPATLAMVLSWLIFTAICKEDPTSVLGYNERLQALCIDHEVRYWQPFGAACAEWALFQADSRPSHLERLLAAASQFRERYFTSILLILGARMCLKLGQVERGLQIVTEAKRFIEEHDERIWEAEAYRLHAELLVNLEIVDRNQAEEFLRTALRIAQAQKAAWLVERVQTSLAQYQFDVQKVAISPAATIANFT